MHMRIQNDNLINQCISLHVRVQDATRLERQKCGNHINQCISLHMRVQNVNRLERQKCKYKNIIRSIYKYTDALITTCQHCIKQQKVHHK